MKPIPNNEPHIENTCKKNPPCDKLKGSHLADSSVVEERLAPVRQAIDEDLIVFNSSLLIFEHFIDANQLTKLGFCVWGIIFVGMHHQRLPSEGFTHLS